jgi:hypothetical protein
MQEGIEDLSFPLFTDPRTGGTFGLTEGQTVYEALKDHRETFGVLDTETPAKEAHPTQHRVEFYREWIDLVKSLRDIIQVRDGIIEALIKDDADLHGRFLAFQWHDRETIQLTDDLLILVAGMIE